MVHKCWNAAGRYIESCREVLAAKSFPIEIEEIVTLGHHLTDYRRLISEHDVDLLVLNTKDEDQLAIHGAAYPLSVELRFTPLLLLCIDRSRATESSAGKRAVSGR